MLRDIVFSYRSECSLSQTVLHYCKTFMVPVDKFLLTNNLRTKFHADGLVRNYATVAAQVYS